jgi:flagellar FliL protein
MFDTGTKIINLAEPTGRRYIRVNIVLEIYPTNPDYVNMGHEEQQHYLEEFNQEVEESLPIINDSLISELSSKTFEEVYTAEGKEIIREEIVTLLNEKLPDHHIMNVYFTEFVVQ